MPNIPLRLLNRKIMNNKVIKVNNETEFQRAIQYWKSALWNCGDYKYDAKFPYIGVVHKAFGMWAVPMGVEVITLPTANQVIKVNNQYELALAIRFWEDRGQSCYGLGNNDEWPTYLGYRYDGYFGWQYKPSDDSGIISLPVTPKHGDTILVWDEEIENGERQIFSSMGHPMESHPVRCVNRSDVEKFLTNQKYGTVSWRNWKPIPTKRKLTLSEIAEKFYLTADQIEII